MSKDTSRSEPSKKLYPHRRNLNKKQVKAIAVIIAWSVAVLLIYKIWSSNWHTSLPIFLTFFALVLPVLLPLHWYSNQIVKPFERLVDWYDDLDSGEEV